MWYGREALELDFPDRWDIRLCPMADAPPLDDAAVGERLARPVGAPPLQQLAAGRRNCCILVDDLTRPTPAGRILAHLLPALHGAGLGAEDVFFIVANGTHRSLTRQDLVKKLGEGVCDRYVVMRHDCHQNLVDVGQVRGIGRVLVNRFFYEADLKLAITGVTPHFMSGFSGGAKMVMPAVCGLETIARSHERTVEGRPARVGVIEGNPMRAAMNQCARMVGLDFAVCCVFNSRGDLCDVHCGGVEPAFEAAVGQARGVYATDVPYGSDLAVFNAFPKDTEFIQAMSALNVWADRSDRARDLVRPGGTIAVICACSEGLGSHQLIEYGRRQFRRRDQHGSFRDVLGGRNLLFLAPNVSPATVRLYYPAETRVFRQWGPLREALEELHPHGARAAVFPASALQIDREFLARYGSAAAG
jgi:nickel-dependent lactate racemase